MGSNTQADQELEVMKEKTDIKETRLYMNQKQSEAESLDHQEVKALRGIPVYL